MNLSCTIGQLYISLHRTSMEKLRTVTLYKEYFTDFYNKQRQKVKDKILWTFKIIEITRQIPTDYFKYIEGTDGLYEIRVSQGGDIFRIFCFFDEGNLIVMANGFQKKTQKTPKSEIEKALKIKHEYEEEEKH